MYFPENKILNPKSILNISSDYINYGRAKESWKIDKITIAHKSATMQVSMNTIYGNSEDFHLSIYLAEEMASQLMIICGHIWAELDEKKKEVWMLESNTKNIRPIRDTKNIVIELYLKTLRKRGDTIVGIADFIVSDNNEGLIKITQKGLLS